MAKAEMIRLLICAACKSIEELPWYEGPPEHDDLKNYRLSFHRFASGNQHPFTIGDVGAADWKSPVKRQLILETITKHVDGVGEDGLGAEFYDLKANFQQDALDCWRRHGRRTDCEDFESDSRRLLPDTAAERRDASSRTFQLSPRNRPYTYLCQFCPVGSRIEGLKNQEKLRKGQL